MRRGRALSLLVSSFALPLAVVPGAHASKVIAPPGNSGVSQYVEVVPGAGGSTPVGAHASHGPVLSTAQRRRLETSGPSGKALASFVQQTGVARSKGKSSGRAGHGRPGAPGSAVGGISRGASGRSAGGPQSLIPARSTGPGGGGLGWGLPAALGAIALAAAGIAVARRRIA